MSIADAITAYLDYLRDVTRRSPATIEAYRADLRRFLQYLGDAASTDLEAVTVPLIETWMGTMRGLADASLRRRLNSLSGLFRWAVRFGHTPGNPLDQVQRPRKKRRVEPCPSSDEIAAMLQAAHGDMERAALLAMATSGLRRAEALALTWDAVDLQTERIRIRGKGDKDREVLIFPDFLAALHILHAKAGLPAQGHVLCGRQGKPLQKSTLQRWLNGWLARASLRDEEGAGRRNRFTLHSLRRFAAKRWLESGLNIRHVQLLLGHEDLQTTILYLNYNLDEVQAAARSVTFGLQPVPTLTQTEP